jgi:CBS domain-containing protein
MNATDIHPLTAGHLMSRDVVTVRADMPLQDAAKELARRRLHGAPVVDNMGHCVGVLSVSDLVRWAADRGEPKIQRVRTCSFQEKQREPGGQETIQCRLPDGACPYQKEREMADGGVCLACTEAHSVLTDWQMVEMESLPGEAVRDFMTTTVVTAKHDTPVPELARLMLQHHIQRLVVLDTEEHAVGIVSVNDLLIMLAHPEHIPAGDPH